MIARSRKTKSLWLESLLNLKYKDGQRVAEHLSDFQEVSNEFSSIKLVSDDEVQELLLLSSLPDSYKTLVVSISNSAPNRLITLSMVTHSFFNENARKRELGVRIS